MLTYDQLPALIALLEALIAQISLLNCALQLTNRPLTQASGAVIAAFAIRAHETLNAIDGYVAKNPTAPHSIPRQRALAAITQAHTQLIVLFLGNSERYLREALEAANELQLGSRPIDRESRGSLADLSDASRLALLGVENQLYRLPDCQGRIIFDPRDRLPGECGIDECFCGK